VGFIRNALSGRAAMQDHLMREAQIVARRDQQVFAI
jgi:hypothetical protein